MELNMDLLQKLINLVKDAQIGELTVRFGDWRVTIRKNTFANPFAFKHPEKPEQRVEGEKSASYVTITSGWIGIVLCQQNGKPFVQVGDTVKRGQTVCLIDSLGVRNEVRAPENGRIVDMFIKDGQAVEFGQPLMLLEPVSSGGE